MWASWASGERVESGDANPKAPEKGKHVGGMTYRSFQKPGRRLLWATATIWMPEVVKR